MMFELLCPIKKNAKENPQSPAILTDRDIISYKSLDEHVEKIVELLQKKGLQKGQRAAFIALQSHETILLLFALCRMQVTACPITTRLPKEQIQSYIDHLQASFYIDVTTLHVEYISYEHRPPYFEEKPLFSLMSTSGSSSKPKIVAHSFENFYYSALGSHLILSLSHQHRWLLSLPLYHVGGIAIAFRCFLSGACIVTSEQPTLAAIERYHITHISLVPTQLYRMLKHEDCKYLKTLQAILVGGAPLPRSLFLQAKQLGLKLHPTYGLTEMSSQVAMEVDTSSLELTSGSILPFRQLKISPEGEIFVKGKTLFYGYWMGEEGFYLPLENGWFATKDLGFLNAEGKVEVIGRKDNMFISGGENIHPERIENELLEIPGIVQAVVVPIDDVEFGQRPIAFIETLSGYILEDEIRETLKTALSKFCIPIRFLPIPQQVLGSMKISRSYFKELARHHVVEPIETF